MSRKGLWIAAVVVIVSNVYALGSAAFNRRGEPDAVIDLTERELRVTPREAENTAMAFRLAWTDLAVSEADAGWFDAARLAEIGFDCRLPVTMENAAHYRAMPPRSTYAVFDYGGETWQRYVASLPAAVDRGTTARRSRLVFIDVGNDPRLLRARHPDRRRTIVVPATAGLVFVPRGNGAPFLKGRLNMVFPMELNVPHDARRTLDALPSLRELSGGRYDRAAWPLPRAPRYQATVKWGSALEPWVESVQTIDEKR
jgi:hypothetical protein